jgi:hypothetical protein
MFDEDRRFWSCDNCGDRRPLRRDFHTDWAALKSEGWRAYRDSDGWLHWCGDCEAAEAAKLGSRLDRPNMKVVK